MRLPWTALRYLLGLHRRGRTSARRQTRTRLFLEPLENRVVPTIVFQPQFGAETATYNGGPTLTGAPIELIFWGSYWNNVPAGKPTAAQLTTAITNEFNSPIYNNLSQYNAGPAHVDRSWVATEDPDPSSSGFTEDQLRQVITDAINDPRSPLLAPSDIEATDGGHAPIYLVITPPTIACTTVPEAGGFHNIYSGNTYAGNENIVYGWVGNLGGSSSRTNLVNFSSQDFVTVVASHEAGETLTDPQPLTGWTVTAGATWPGPTFNEIFDQEPAATYTYRLNGSLVQALWDQNAEAYTVSDGTIQNFVLVPQYTEGFFGSILDLYANQDQLSNSNSPGSDSVTIDTTASGGLAVNMNGEVATFDPGAITAINVFTGGGTNTVNVLGTPEDVPTDIVGGGNDTVNLGDNGSTLRIQGDVYIENPPSFTTINIGDWADPSSRTVNIQNFAGKPPDSQGSNDTWGQITGLLGPKSSTASILFEYPDISSVTLDTGTAAGNVVNVLSAGAPLTINSNGPNTITVGDSNGVQDIKGALTVNGFLDNTSLYLNDKGDGAELSFTVNANTITNLAPATITYSGVGLLQITTGKGSDLSTVLNTAPPLIFKPPIGPPVVLGTTTTDIDNGDTGGNLVVNVDGTQSELDILDAFLVEVGNGKVQDIQGDVKVNTSIVLSVTLEVNDLNDPNGEQAQLGFSTEYPGLFALTDLAPATIAFGSHVGLHVHGFGPGGTFTVNDTLAFTNTGIESTGTVNVLGTTGDLGVSGGILVDIGLGNTQNINGQVSVSGSVPLVVDDSADKKAKVVTVGHAFGSIYSITGLSQAPIDFMGGAVPTVTIDSPNTGVENSIDVNGTPAGTALTLHNGFGNVTVLSVPNIGGPVTVALGEDNTTYWFDGPATDNNRIYTTNSTSVTRTGGFVTNIVYPSGFASESFALFTGNPFTDTINVQSSLPHTGWFLDGAPFNPNVFNIGDPAKGLAAVQGEIHINTEAEPGSPDVETVTLNDQPDTPSTNPSNSQTFTFSYDPNQNLNNVSWDGGGFLAYNNTPPPLGNLVINAGRVNTTFQVKTIPAVSTAITLNGGSGSNTLDYSKYVGDITVDLPLGVATGFSAVNNIENVTGSQGNDLIVGGPKNGVFIGGTGRNLIIGGAGADQITGGGGDNILIGGTTAYDNSTAGLTALEAIFAVWTDPTLTIGERTNEIKKGIVVNGQIVALNKDTVSADKAPDSLIGGAGVNWFFVDSDDTIDKGAGPGPNDEITHV